jgi:K+-transporting ATPase KdpF subunit
MNGSEIIGLVLSVGLLVYLMIALLKPEWFA